MKTIASGPGFIVSGPDYSDQSITVNGQTWHFDFDIHCGPLWLRKDGEPRKCQCPTSKYVWEALQVWHDATVPNTPQIKGGKPRIKLDIK